MVASDRSPYTNPVFLSLAIVISLVCQTTTVAQTSALRFEDVTQSCGLLESLSGINGHGAGWGDLNADGFPELLVGTFDKSGDHPHELFVNRSGRQFLRLPGGPHRVSARANSILCVDFDNDGDLDVYLSHLSGGKTGHTSTDSRLLRNDGGPSKLVDISQQSGACPPGFRGRGATVLDYDGDGNLDLLIGEALHYGSSRRSRLLRNLGGMRFEDVSSESGLPEGITGLGTAAGDVNGDGWPDLFLAGRYGGNRLFLNVDGGSVGRQFVEHPQSPQLFAWEFTDADDTPAGVCFADLNRDGRLDFVIGQHYGSPWRHPVPIRAYLNRGTRKQMVAGHELAVPRFEDVTEQAGLLPLFLKAPHVEVQDFDNDGHVDISTSVVRFAADQVVPVIFRGTGLTADGIPKFESVAQGVNDYPTAEDRSIARSSQFFAKLLADRRIIYTAPAPSADFDRDGRLDLFFANWFPESPSMLLRNTSAGGHWIEVTVAGSSGINAMGVGSRISVYRSGQAGSADALLGYREISVGFGYASGHEAVAHFGLGDVDSCDLVIEGVNSLARVVREHVSADQRIQISLSGAVE